ncbi:MAG TPA: hypothetical protein VF175_10090 [Lacipirellula sp.]
MRRLSTFIFGMVAGGLLIYVVLNFHVVQARDGMHLVPKVDAKLAGAYVDIRNFTPADWQQHPEVAMAIFRAERGDLLESAASDALQNGLDELLQPQMR